MKAEQIKREINILDLLSRLGIEISKSGFIKSIFKEEKNPSLKIYPDSNSFYDFSSGQGGDIISFVEGYFKIDFKEAIKKIEEIFSLSYGPLQPVESPSLIKPTVKETAPETTEERNKRIEIYESLQDFCFYSLHNEEKNYLINIRKIEEKTLQKFGVFSVKDYKKANDFLKKCYSIDQLQKAGVYNEKGNLIFYKHRILFPYYENGRIINLRGRTIENNPGVSKYLGLRNLSSKIFYNFDLIKQLRANDILYITEGELDCLSLTILGYNVIAIPGVTSFPPLDQWYKLKPFDIHILFDNDLPGENATEKVKDISKLIQKKINIKKLNKTKDINEILTGENNE